MRYQIGHINRLTGRTTETIRRAEQAGLIPQAQRVPGGYRYWDEGDLPAICEGLGVPSSPSPAERLFQEALALLGIEPAANLDDMVEQVQGILAQATGSMLETAEGT